MTRPTFLKNYIVYCELKRQKEEGLTTSNVVRHSMSLNSYTIVILRGYPHRRFALLKLGGI